MRDHAPLLGIIAAIIVLSGTLVGLSLIDKKEDGPVLLAVASAITGAVTALGVIAQKIYSGSGPKDPEAQKAIAVQTSTVDTQTRVTVEPPAQS
jgi:hypothetical protein